MNLGVEEQAQRRKKEKRRSRRNKDGQAKEAAPQEQVRKPSMSTHERIFKTKTIKIKQRKIGLVIGPSGKNIRKLYQLTHCDILLPRKRPKQPDETTLPSSLAPDGPDDDDRFETYDGNFFYSYDARNDTVQTNLPSLREEPKKQPPKPPKQKKKDPKKKKDGKDDEKGEDDEEEEDPDDPNRMIEIKLRGTPEELRDAEVEINFMIKNGRLMLDHERMGSRQQEDLDGTDAMAEDIRVPSKICGMLIGGGGQRVKELMDETGAEIWVDWDRESHLEAGVSTVHLKGTQECVEMAKSEIRRIQKLFEKGSNTMRFEIPAICSRTLFDNGGANLKMLQKQYNVSITVKNFRFERNSIRIGDQDEEIQRTVMIILIGEYRDQMACRKGIEKLVGSFVKCAGCAQYRNSSEGYPDKYSSTWYCQGCWDEFNGVNNVKPPSEAEVQHRMQNFHLSPKQDDYNEPPQKEGKPPPQQQHQQNHRYHGGRRSKW